MYAEDMITVLMDDARPDQKRPGLAASVDLLSGALLAWAPRVVTFGRAWPKARVSAAVAVLALFALCILSIRVTGYVLDAEGGSSYGRWGEAAIWLSDWIWPLVLAAAVVGLRRTAAWLAWGVGIILPMVSSLVSTALGGWYPGYLGSVNAPLWFAVSLIAAVGLSTDPGLRRGFQVLGRTATDAAAVGTVAIGVNSLAVPFAVDRWLERLSLPILAVGVALFALACLATIAQIGRTATRLAAVGIAVLVVLCALYRWQDGGAGWRFDDWGNQIDLAVPLMVLGCGLAVAWSMARASERSTMEQISSTEPMTGPS